MAMIPRSIEVSIDELVLEGCSSGARYRVGAALEAELARLLHDKTRHRHYASGKEIPVIHAGITSPSGQSADELGASLAAAIFAALHEPDAHMRRAS